jgi:predicted DNA-binding protein (UPF0251 family)
VDIKELLHRLWNADKFARAIRLRDEVAEDFLQFVALQHLRGKCLGVPHRLVFIDFLRHYEGRGYKPTAEELYFKTTEPRATLEEEVIARLDAKKRVEKLLRRCTQKERILLRLLFWYDLSQKEAADLLGVSEAAISHMLAYISRRFDKNKTLAESLK